MSQNRLKEGRVLKTDTGESVKVGKKFGGGGQGFVHHCIFRGRKAVLKVWHLDAVSAVQIQELRENALRDSPCLAFAWPMAVVVNHAGKITGYVMEFVGDESTVTLADRLVGKSKATYWAMLTAQIGVTQAMIALHSQGRFYGDLNTNNILFNKHGIAWLCDCDNVVREGVDIGILFTFGAASPSIVRGETRPGMASDLFSLAAIHFMFLTGGIPLEGIRAATACAPNFKQLCALHGTNPLFIFHPTDDRNRPHPVAKACTSHGI